MRLRDVLRAHPGLALLGAVAGPASMLPTALLPLVIGAAVDGGIAGGESIAGWIAVVLALAAVQAVASAATNWTSHTLWVAGASHAQRALIGQVTALGAALPRRVRTGDVVAMGSDDVFSVGNAVEQYPRAIGATVTFAVVATVLVTVAPLLGLVALIGVPLAVLGIGGCLRPLQRRKEQLREEFADVNAIGADVVAGLRVLRGIGGEQRFHRRFVAASSEVRSAGLRVGSIEAWIAAIEVVLTGLVIVTITWLGAAMAVDGAITAGELVAFYGASAYLVVPVGAAGEASAELAAGWVACRKLTGLLQQPVGEPPPDAATLPPGPLSLADADGVGAAGECTVLDADRARAERLGGLADGTDVTLGGVPLRRVDPAELRSRLIVVLGDDVWFSGPVGAELAAGDRIDVDTAIWAADATDVIDALPDGYATQLSERGRSVSGGQRQRLLLARALTADPDVLVLEEPTSAVDAHTERRIVDRVCRLRAGRTTVVLTSSPIWHNAAGRHEEGR